MDDIAYVGITRKTPKTEALKLGECKKGRDCEECSKLCQLGSGALADEDIAPLAKFLGVTEEQLKKEYLEEVTKFGTTRWKPKLVRENTKDHHGRCMFYNDHEKCTIHTVKPLECRISTCEPHGDAMIEWFLLNYFVNTANPHSIREWAARLKTHSTIPGGEVEELVPDMEMLKQIMNYEVLS